jgi:TonB family protein
MIKFVPFVAAVLLCLPAASAATVQKPEPARARANLASYLSASDYPDEAIRNEEQGTVGFQLDVGSDGKPTRCLVTQSSGSTILDETTCRLMTERPRFEPARDARGRPVPDQVSGSIRWVLPEEPLSGAALRAQTALELWHSCVVGEIAKLVPGSLPADGIAQRAFLPCAPLEKLFAKEIGQPVPLAEQRKSVLGNFDLSIRETRAALNSPDDPAAPEPQP